MSLSDRERLYIRARLDGATDAEAAAAAGYEGRAPSRVCKLASRAKLLRAEPELMASYKARAEDLQAKIESIREKQLRPLYAEASKLSAMAAVAALVFEAHNKSQT